MIIFLYGKDTYRLQQKLKEIGDRYRKIHKTGLNLEKIEADKIDFQDFWDRFRQPSMFIKKKLFFLENLLSSQQFKEEFLKKIPQIGKSQDIIIVFEKNELPKNDKFSQALKKYGKSQEFKPLGGKKLKDWITKEFQKYGVAIEEKALEKLIDSVGNNLWQMQNEIQKLSVYKNKQKPGQTQVTAVTKVCPVRVRAEDVELLVRSKIETDIFATIDAIAARQKKQALKLLKEHLEKGDSPLYLLSMINYQFRNLLMLKSCELRGEFNANYVNVRTLSGRLKLHPYVVRKTMFQARKFSFEELKKIYQKIFQVDLNIKTGKIEPETALDMLIAEI